MAQWSHSDKTLYAKLVYYGPAFGGKTTNLESLHRITDPEAKQKLLTIQTSDDRTLFFDLLPFDLGEILGYKVALKVYTVPGQVRFDVSRQVVLAGADVIVFVADSSMGREEQNRWSLQNLKMNMRAKRLDPARVPVVYQFNKQDLPDAAPPEEVASWLGVPPGECLCSVATEDTGVVETFVAACRILLETLVAHADEKTRERIDARGLDQRLERAFAPLLARRAADAGAPAAAGTGSTSRPIVLADDDLLRSSIECGTVLGEKLTAETARAERLEREAEAYRRLSDALRGVEASFDRGAILDSALSAVAEIPDSRVVSLVRRTTPGKAVVERVSGRPEEPLAAGAPELLERMLGSDKPCVVEDLPAECGNAGVPSSLEGLTSAVSVPVPSSPSCALLAYLARPDGGPGREDVRFLDTVAGHLAAGLEKVGLHEELERHRNRLEEIVESRTEQLRRAYDELCRQEQRKDRFLHSLSHEMKTPLTAILSSAVFLRDYKGNSGEREEMIGSIVRSAEAMHERLEDLFRVIGLEGDQPPLRYTPTDARRLADEGLRLSGASSVRVKLKDAPKNLRVDPERLSRAVSNLLENAVKFSPQGSPVELRIREIDEERAGRSGPGVSISVLDRGPGVAAEDRERIFSPFEQGGDPLTAKPSGIGIGLYEARAIAQQHGGTLKYRPRKGGGSEFRIEIPTQPCEAEPSMESVGA